VVIAFYVAPRLRFGLVWMVFRRSKSAAGYPTRIRSRARAVLFCIDAQNRPIIAYRAKFFLLRLAASGKYLLWLPGARMLVL